jgi:hypothetical protein
VADLSSPAERKLAQNRSITCAGYAREDGLWDIEAHLLDTKTASITYPSFGMARPAGHPVHEMKIRVTIDSDMVIHAAEAATLHAPFDACVIPATIFPKLKGLSFDKGWKEGVSEIMGGTAGCTHLLQLLGNIATFSYQTMASSDDYLAKIDSGEIRPFFIDRCYTYDASGPVIKQFYPDFHRPQDLKIKS